MKIYRIKSIVTSTAIIQKPCVNDKAAKKWLENRLERGILSDAVVLEARTMSDEDAAKLPPFANGKKQSAWRLV